LGTVFLTGFLATFRAGFFATFLRFTLDFDFARFFAFALAMGTPSRAGYCPAPDPRRAR
jgi:hypothetical protein